MKKDWRYFFIKYPNVIQYCKEGNFLWQEDGRTIYLLKSEKNTIYKAKEIYSKVMQDYFRENLKIPAYSNNECFFMRIDFDGDRYFITESYEDSKLILCVRNNGQNFIEHWLEVNVNGNTKAVKFLEEFKWEKNSEGNFERFGNSKLLTLGDNYEENLSNSIEAITKLLKNGLRIKLQ